MKATMKTFQLVALLIFTGVCIFLSTLIGWLMTEPVNPPSVNMPAELLPGNPLPAHTACIPTYSYAEQYCWSGDVYFQYDMEAGEITHSSIYLYDQGVTVGELVIAWGSPSGYRRDGADFINVYWADRYVYVIGKIFGPDNKVVLVAWDASTQLSTPWKGWIKGEH
jgi:hypothetical protein